VAKILAYADCSIKALSNTDPSLCDCNRIVDVESTPIAPDRPDKEKELSIKTDWKYVGESSYKFVNPSVAIEKPLATESYLFIPQQYLQAVFHPPQS